MAKSPRRAGDDSLALFLFVLVILAGFGQCIWIIFDGDRALDPNKSILHREGWPLWKEVAVAYTVGLLTPAALLLLVGRLRCGGAPSEAHARGLALSAAFFTLIGFGGAIVYLGMTYTDLGAKWNVPEVVAKTSLIAAIPGAILADVFTLLFIGQIGWSSRPAETATECGRPCRIRVDTPRRRAHRSSVLSGLVGDHPNPCSDTGRPLGEPESETAQRAIIWAVIVLAAVVMMLLRYAGVAGSARRAIRKLLAGEA